MAGSARWCGAASPTNACSVVHLSCDHPARIALRIGIDSPQAGEVTHEQGALLLAGRNAGFAGIEGRLRFALRVLPRASGGITRIERGRK